MEQSSPPLVFCRFTLCHLEVELETPQPLVNGFGCVVFYYKHGEGGTITRATTAENLKAGICFVEFLNALLGDLRVQRCFQRLYEKLNLPISHHLSVGEFVQYTAPYKDSIQADLETFLRELSTLLGELTHYLDAAFWMHVWGLLTQEPQTIPFSVSYLTRPAPQVSFSFAPRPGETDRAMLQRFEREAMAVRSHLEEQLPHGADPIPTDLALEAEGGVGKYARWLYQHLVCNKSVRLLAKEYNTDRNGIRYGLRRAKHFLDLAE
jgi:hypothetical protein